MVNALLTRVKDIFQVLRSKVSALPSMLRQRGQNEQAKKPENNS